MLYLLLKKAGKEKTSGSLDLFYLTYKNIYSTLNEMAILHGSSFSSNCCCVIAPSPSTDSEPNGCWRAASLFIPFHIFRWNPQNEAARSFSELWVLLVAPVLCVYSSHLWRGILERGGFHDLGGSVAVVPLLFPGNLLLHLVNVTGIERGRKKKRTILLCRTAPSAACRTLHVPTPQRTGGENADYNI